MSSSTMKEVLNILENLNPFPSKNPIKDKTRMNVVGGKEKAEEGKLVLSFSLGLTRAYDKPYLVPTVFNRKFPDLHILLRRLIKEKDPSFKYTTITINKNVRTEYHIDKNNIGKSFGLSLGDFTGGGIEIKYDDNKTKFLDTHNKLILFDGHLEHRTLPYKGNRYSLTYFKKK